MAVVICTVERLLPMKHLAPIDRGTTIKEKFHTFKCPKRMAEQGSGQLMKFSAYLHHVH